MAGINTNGLASSNDAQMGDLEVGFTQLEYAQTPRRYTFRIVASPETARAIDVKVLGRPMKNLAKGIVDEVTLKINPQTYRMTEPTREGITQTVSGAWVDWYGLGLPKILMGGTTGWNPNRARNNSGTSKFALIGASVSNMADQASLTASRLGFSALTKNPDAPTGLQDFVYLRNRIFRTYAMLLQKMNLKFDKRIQDQLQLQFFAWDTEDYCVVLFDQFELQRSVARPMLYDYNISMTVIGYVGDRASAIQDYLANLNNPSTRFNSILSSLQSFSNWVANTNNSIKSFAASIALTIESVAVAVNTIEGELEDVINNVESLITTPLQSVQLITASLRDVAQSVLNIEQLPEAFKNDIHNQLLETWCALSGLTTYPSLFKTQFQDDFSGAPWANLNCSSTLGVPPNPTIPDPGVSTPPSNIPPNSFDRPQGSRAPRAIAAQAPQTAPYRIKEVAIRDGDSVESVILRLGGLNQDIAQVWQQIATLNKLEHPYIVGDPNFQTEVKATVSVIFTGIPATFIPAGTRVGTAAITSNDDIIFFRTIVDVTLDINGKATVVCRAEKPGDFANVQPLTVTQFIDAVGQPKVITGVNVIENPEPGKGGKIYRVLKTGQRLQIPVSLNTSQGEIYLDRSDTIEENLFGIDIDLDANGDMTADGTGDMQVVSGIHNMGAAVQDRLKTDRGELLKHPEYGMNLARMIGEPGDQNYLTTAKLELRSTMLQDTRITSVNNLILAKAQDVLNASMNLVLVDETTRPTSAEVPL